MDRSIESPGGATQNDYIENVKFKALFSLGFNIDTKPTPNYQV